jgi:hypothetical protein
VPSTGRTYTVSLIERGREQPPRVYRDSRPEAVPEGCSRPGIGVANTRECRAICAPFARALSRAYTQQITRGSHCTFNTHLRKYSRSFGHHIVSVELCSGVVKARRYAPTRCAGLRALTTPCAQLEGSTYVMAEEARCIFHIDQSSRQTYGEDLVDAITHPLRSRIRRGALQPSLSELRCSPFNN